MNICPKCGGPQAKRRQGLYCDSCHSAYMRDWRKSHPMTADQRFKDNARSYAGVYLRRGKIEKKPCRDCGCAKAEMHHEDYTKPLEVIWLCRPCHLKLHAMSPRGTMDSNLVALS